MSDDLVKFPAWTRARNAQRVSQIQQSTREGRWDLDEPERWWRDRQPFLESRGYLLRPRFRPGWVPSWLETDIIPAFCEDSYRSMHTKTIDAKRLSDGEIVVIKQVPSDSTEANIAQLLTTAERLQNPENHCVPILDRFHNNAEPNVEFIVMPLLREFDDPPFFTVSEAVDFIKQTLEGLKYIHDQGVAHRDCADLNIMLDGSPLFLEGFHPTVNTFTPSAQKLAKPLRRSDVSSVNYYFTDFGISTHFTNPTTPRLVTGIDGQDKEVPELSSDVPYNPFPVDIFILGNLYKKTFVEEYANMAFLAPLTTSMTQRDPKARPTAAYALAQFRDLIAKQPAMSLRWRLRRIDESATTRVYQDIRSMAREAFILAKRLTGSPIFFAALFVAASGSALSVLYGQNTFLTRLHSILGRSIPINLCSPRH